MKVTYNWLKDFVDIKISPKVLAEKLTMAGLEVTSLEEKDGDFVFELEITSNRPDCLSVIGIAREVAAITGKELRLPQATGSRPHAKNITSVQRAACNAKPFIIKIENKKDCPLYTAKIIKDVRVGPSPAWLKKRLELIGCRSVNNIVDITNYILFTWGQPLHAFDLDRLNPGKIIVRRGKNNERLTTIDAELKMVTPDILVIADKQNPVAIAGIMGGKETEVTYSTKNILLETAVFNPIIVRRGRQKLGVQSESAYRFERGADLAIVDVASGQAVELIKELAVGSLVLAKNSGLPKPKKKNINLGLSTVHKILGVNIPAAKIKKILNSLGFKTRTKVKNHFSVEIPTQRPDINLEIDLIEEIARIFGYENIPKSLPAVKPQVIVCQGRELVCLIKDTLKGLGLNEVITYSLVDNDLLRSFAIGQEGVIQILNPLSRQQEILRPRLIPSLSRCLAYNLNQKQDYINIFEVAKAFLWSGARPKEELALGIGLCGIRSGLGQQGLIKEEIGFLHLKGISEALFNILGIKDYSFGMVDTNKIVVNLKQETVGVILRLSKSTLESLDIKNKNIWTAELSLDRLFSHSNLKKRFAPLPIYPGISRDISLILKEGVLAGDILEAIREKARPLLQEIKIIDYYKGKQIPRGYKGLTISCLYRSDERTLTEAEINPLHSGIASMLKEKFAVQIRERNTQ